MNNHIYLHEIIRTVPGREESYLASVLSLHHDPMRGDREGRAAFAQFRSVQTSGPWPCAVNIWENTWAGQTEDLVGQFLDTRRDAAMEEWWNRNLHLRRGGYDRILVPAACSPARADLVARDVRCEVLWHEIAWLPFGEPLRYLDLVGRELVPALDRLGLVLVGAFRVAMRPRQVRDDHRRSGVAAARRVALRRATRPAARHVERVPRHKSPIAPRRCCCCRRDTTPWREGEHAEQ